MIKEVLQEKELNFKFLMAIQEQEYQLAYELGKQVLKEDPGNPSVNRFMIFLQQNMQHLDGLLDWEYCEEQDQDEVDNEEEEEDEDSNADESEEEAEEPEADDDEWEYYQYAGDEPVIQEDNTETDLSFASQPPKPKTTNPRARTPATTLPKIQKRPISQNKPQQPIQQFKQISQKPSVKQLRFPSAMAKK